MQDWQLLRQYVDNGSQDAFAQLARRYTNFVYATCRREVGDAHLAEDVTQAVFLLLARKAPGFRRGTTLAGWLFKAALLASRGALRQERRRRVREQKAVELMDANTVLHNAAWDEIEPHFNAALLTLKPCDREAILLRLCDDLSLRETGEALGLSEDAARKRVTRAIEKMRGYLVKHGIIISATSLAALVGASSANASVPAACVARIADFYSQTLSHGATVAASAKAVTIAQGALKSMTLTTIKVAATVTCGLIFVAGGALALRHPWHKSVHAAISSQSGAPPQAAWSPAEPKAARAYAMLKEAEAATAATQSLIADCSFISRISRPENPVRETTHQSVSVRLMRPYFCRYEAWLLKKSPIGGEWIKDALFESRVSDGTTYWDYDARNNTVTKRPTEDLARSLDLLALPVFDFFYGNIGRGGYWTSSVKSYQDTQRELRYVGEEKWEGGDYQVVQWSYAEQALTDYLLSRNKDAMKNVPGGKVIFTWRFYIGKDKLIHRLIRKMDPGYTYEAAMRNVRLGESLSPSEFAFTPPVGAKVRTQSVRP